MFGSVEINVSIYGCQVSYAHQGCMYKIKIQ